VQLQELVQFHEAARRVAYCRVAVVSVDPPRVQAAFKAGLGARFPFLSDEQLELTDALGIRETTDKIHGPLPVPFTVALLPDLEIHRIFNGWYFVGRPTPEELRLTARELIGRSVPDADFRGN
jgi:peroxiredoxin